MKLKKIEIKRFRSINNLSLELDTECNFISICGPNNVGKTNVLRALNLFFNPNNYSFAEDAPYLKQHTRGGTISTEIFLTIEDNDNSYVIERKFELKKGTIDVSEAINKLIPPTKRKKEYQKKPIDKAEIKKILDKFVFFYIPAINISFPKLIDLIINDVYELEFEKSRFSGLKGELKKSFNEYNSGLVEILNQLASEINPLFQQFNLNWTVEFKSNAEVKKFQDLISQDISFYINDKSIFNNENKGSGLQKLGFILLHQKIIEKLSKSKKNIIFCIDEPDAFLHRGLQLKLKEVLYSISNKHQVFVATHSPEFIDSINLKNVILLDQEIQDANYYARPKEYIHPINTISIDLSDDEGARKIREYLGLEDSKADLLNSCNIFVEGECDRIYLEELCKFFEIKAKKIFPINGVTKYVKTLEFYNDWYADLGLGKKPKIILLFDNDEEGRKSFREISNKNFKNIEIECKFIPDRLGKVPDIKNLQATSSNLEIEDFIFPELVFHLSSLILGKKKDLTCFTWKDLERKLDNIGFANKGILAIMDDLLIDKNPNVDISSFSFSSPSMKRGLASPMKLDANPKIIKLLRELDKKYPKVREFLSEIMK